MSSRFLFPRVWQRMQSLQTFAKEKRGFASSVAKDDTAAIKEESVTPDVETQTVPSNYRYVYPEFLPDPNPLYRNSLREKLERMDMISRRAHLTVPEFYVGSILAVTYSEPHAPGKTNRFVGICIDRIGCGLRSSFILRNVVDGQGMEVLYQIYDPTIQKIECLRLERRLDNRLYYLRDAALEYSTFPFDMEQEFLPEGAEVPLNELKVPLKSPPWSEKWEIQYLKGIQPLELNEKRQKRAKDHFKPWEKYDLMKQYRSTIPEEEQKDIFAEIHTELSELDLNRQKLKRRRVLIRPKAR